MSRTGVLRDAGMLKKEKAKERGFCKDKHGYCRTEDLKIAKLLVVGIT